MTEPNPSLKKDLNLNAEEIITIYTLLEVTVETFYFEKADLEKAGHKPNDRISHSIEIMERIISKISEQVPLLKNNDAI